MKNILIIDDDEKLNALLAEFLSRQGFTVGSATRPSKGLYEMNRLKPDLIILDVMLPEQDGFSVCESIRKKSNVPILMLTARGDVEDRITGLQTGADDYLPKPFEPRELLARIQAIFRRFDPNQTSTRLQCGSLNVDPSRQIAEIDGENIGLTTNEFEALYLFMANANKIMSRDALLNHLRGIECDSFNRSVDIIVSRLRKKIGDTTDNPKYFKTVWGKGYMFIGDVDVQA